MSKSWPRSSATSRTPPQTQSPLQLEIRVLHGRLPTSSPDLIISSIRKRKLSGFNTNLMIAPWSLLFIRFVTPLPPAFFANHRIKLSACSRGLGKNTNRRIRLISSKPYRGGYSSRARFLSASDQGEVIAATEPFHSRCGSVPVMATLPVSDSSIDLRAVTVRPTWGAQEHRRWDRLVEQHHYLAFHGVIGKGLRHVAVHGETWLATDRLAARRVQAGARDRWIGWSAEQQFRRLHLIANNSRFVILTPGRVPNLASRVLGLSLRQDCLRTSRRCTDIRLFWRRRSWTSRDLPAPATARRKLALSGADAGLCP